MELIDLHVHSSCSDGTVSPSGLVALASRIGLSAFALTDHDTVDGIPEALEASRISGSPVEVIPGIEFSSEYNGTEIHITGLDLDIHNPLLQERIAYYRTTRARRNVELIQRMAADGIDISPEQMEKVSGAQVLTRAHFARYLATHGYADSISDAFSRFLKEGRPYYIPRLKPSPSEVASLILQAGGIPVLAHPLQYPLTPDGLRALLMDMKSSGVIGMEVLYSSYSPEERQQLLSFAREFDLLPGGGSDFHGDNKPGLQLGTGYGDLQIPFQLLQDLRNRRSCQYQMIQPKEETP